MLSSEVPNWTEDLEKEGAASQPGVASGILIFGVLVGIRSCDEGSMESSRNGNVTGC